MLLTLMQNIMARTSGQDDCDLDPLPDGLIIPVTCFEELANLESSVGDQDVKTRLVCFHHTVNFYLLLIRKLLLICFKTFLGFGPELGSPYWAHFFNIYELHYNLLSFLVLYPFC